jgi:hypothetical protein
MQDYEHEYTTTLNGGPITVMIYVSWYQDDEDKYGQWQANFELTNVYFDGVDVLPILDVNTQTMLEMEAINAIQGDTQ